jgi:hypothetical protein
MTNLCYMWLRRTILEVIQDSLSVYNNEVDDFVVYICYCVFSLEFEHEIVVMLLLLRSILIYDG